MAPNCVTIVAAVAVRPGRPANPRASERTAMTASDDSLTPAPGAPLNVGTTGLAGVLARRFF